MKLPILCAVLLGLAGCGTSASVSPVAGAPAMARKNPAQVQITEGEISSRRARPLGEITVTVRKATAFSPDPTREQVAQALREKAAEIGADAVQRVRYGKVEIGVMSWGQMDGSGQAVAFQ
ncbi:MAG TPA: hypothetical protein VGC80_04955 [Acetobacteraceae bacterium]